MYMNVYMHVYNCMSEYAYVRVCVYIHTHTDIHTHSHVESK